MRAKFKRKRRDIFRFAHCVLLTGTLGGFSGLCPLFSLTAYARAQVIFDVSAQPLGAALPRIADQAGVQVSFVGQEVRSRQSLALRGTMSVDLAFQMAAGPDYEVKLAADDTYVVRRRSPPGLTSASTTAEGRAEVQPPRLDPVIVTARMGPLARTRLEASYAVTRINDQTTPLSGGMSSADLLKAVPGLWVESSGGEASNNIRARGIPRDGYSSLGVYEDGLPVQHDAGLGYLNADQSFRFDESLEAVEVVRGGPASVFASNAPGGLINLIPRAAPVEPQLRVRVQAAGGSYRRMDIWGGRSLGPWRVSAGGFLRRSDGPRLAGFTADDGGQWRIRASRLWNQGRLDLDYKHLDDRVAFYLPVPLSLTPGGEIKPVAGFDALYGTLMGPDTVTSELFNAHADRYPFDLRRGTEIKLEQVTIKFQHNLGKGALTQNLRYRRSTTWRNGLFPGFPRLAADKLQSYLPVALLIDPATDHLGLVYVDNGKPFETPNGLAIDATLSSVRTPLDELISDTRFEGHFGRRAQEHHLTIGLYLAHVDMQMQRLTATTLLEVRGQARRMDIVAYDASGQILGPITTKGITRYGAQFDNYSGSESVQALYATDEWETGADWRADLGVRLERLRLKARIERHQTTFGPDLSHIGDDAILGGTGIFDSSAVDFYGATITAGLARPVGTHGRVYARLTRTERLPNLTDLASRGEYDLRKEPVILSEVGFKRATANSDLHLVVFTTAFSGYRVTDNIYNAQTNSYEQKSAFSDTFTRGLELEGLWRASGGLSGLDMAISATLQTARFQNLNYTELVSGQAIRHDFSGNRLLRVPEAMARLTPGLKLNRGRGRLEATVEYYGTRYADAANTARLPAYTTLNLAASFKLAPHLTMALTANNVAQTLGLTEGNPRAGQFISGDAAATYFAARPIFGRSFRVSFLWRL